MTHSASLHQDPVVFGHDPTPNIVSVHADHQGRAWTWTRTGDHVQLETGTYRPWVFARDLQDVAHLGAQLARDDDAAPYSVRTLDGGEGTLRYLLTGTDAQALKTQIFRGASKRRSSRVSSLRDLSGYYSVGAVESYLMSSGRTYFKGMEFDDPVRLQFDLETTSLSPETGRAFMIAVKDNRGFEQILEARKASQEGEMIESLLEIVRERDPDIIENHNICAFDLPFLAGRAAKLGVTLNFSRQGAPQGLWRVMDGGASPHWACAGREIVDTIDAVRRLNLPSTGLKAVSQLYGVAPEGRVYLEGTKIAETYATQPALVRKYALQDVQEVEALARRVLAPSFALARMAPRPYHRLPYAGTAMGIFEPMMVRAYLHAGRALPGKQDNSAAQLGGSVTLFTEGVLEQVVKADVASMYPSILRVERIGPKSDTLGVFLHLMDHLTTLRLEHKTAAKRGEAGEHGAMQGALKLIVNSAYGLLGSGALSVFGDVEAAGTITRRGREILKNVTDALRERGVILIEADTDGVYFAVPNAWTEADEHRVISDVNALLPDGVTLEFDGRWKAMLSHETKNYALLGYDASLTLKGAAFTSSRGEKYGQAFMENAIRALLEHRAGEIPQQYRSVLDDLAARRLSNADVGSRVRVSKTPEEYRASRAERQEAVYEALIRDVQEWKVNARFTVYQKEDAGLSVLLDPDARDYDARHYQRQLLSGYASRLKKGLHRAEYEQLFAQSQGSLFDVPLDEIRTTWRTVQE